MKLKHKVAIVTGGGKGIGQGIAIAFAQEGAKVVIADCDMEAGTKTANELGAAQGKAIFIKTDVKSSAEIQDMVNATIEKYAQLDILVNNAGYCIAKNVEDTSEQEWEFIINTNLRGTFLCSKYSIPHLRKTKGNIINISSMAALDGFANAGAYSASKGGQVSMTKNMAIDFAPDCIRVNAICPGYIRTPLADDWYSQQKDGEALFREISNRHPLGRYGKIEDVGGAAVYLASNDSDFVTGITLNIDGGITLGY
jgi:NAD(P)-dependent dehydrogenase (short-subunit alcohol dehydrogenase family)